MLKIRAEQMEVFRQYMLRGFEDLMVEHLNRYLPEKSAAVGEEGLRGLIRDGIEKARARGFTIEYDVSRYIALMLLLGPEFEEDERLPWAAEILADERLGGGRKTMDALYERANEYLLHAQTGEGDHS